jgi:uncharacterized membrane protein HdeD (DUF308 family)
MAGVETIVKERNVRWGAPMVLGILMILLGAFALAASVATTLITTVVLGVMLLVVGVMEIIAAVRVGRTGPWLTYLLAGILSLVVGALFLDRPLATMASLTLLIAGFLFAAGLFHGITAIADRYPGWGVDFLYGVVAVALGIYIVASWPISAFWVIGTVVGIEILARGIALVAASWALRSVEHGQIPGGGASYAPPHGAAGLPAH